MKLISLTKTPTALRSNREGRGRKAFGELEEEV